MTEESCFGWVPDFKEFSIDLERLEYILKKVMGRVKGRCRTKDLCLFLLFVFVCFLICCLV